MEETTIKAGEKTRIIRKVSNSMATKYQFSVKPVVSGQTVSGKVEIAGSSWLANKKPVMQALRSDNEVSKGMWDTFYSVYVIPDQDVVVSLSSSQLNSKMIYLVLVIAIIAFAAVLMAAGMGN